MITRVENAKSVALFETRNINDSEKITTLIYRMDVSESQLPSVANNIKKISASDSLNCIKVNRFFNSIANKNKVKKHIKESRGSVNLDDYKTLIFKFLTAGYETTRIVNFLNKSENFKKNQIFLDDNYAEIIETKFELPPLEDRLVYLDKTYNLLRLILNENAKNSLSDEDLFSTLTPIFNTVNDLTDFRKSLNIPDRILRDKSYLSVSRKTITFTFWVDVKEFFEQIKYW
ncbi:MAG: hypothetical protein JHC93_03490 [Parachlamydiales bacterium]|nr:hypothetical protein [Parachlamydiales bacterium]